MELIKLSVLLVALVFSSRIDAIDFATEIEPGPDIDGKAVIILPEEENATVSFQCVAFQNDGLRVTFWFIQRAGEADPSGISLNDPQFVRNGSENQNLTIVSITPDLDRANIWCGPSDTQLEPRFLLGFEVAPQLNSSGTLYVREGENLSVSLEANGNDPFSPLVSFQWTYNGTGLNSSQRITLTKYSISIADVQRQDAGVYQLVVSNGAGYGVGNFTLDVLFGPDATDVSVSPLYFIGGTTVTLVAFTNIEGNPEPSSTWTLNSTTISTDVKFNVSVSGQLSISNISSADAGTYTCTLSNGNITFDKSATIELSEAVLPTMLENVTAAEVNSTSATLTWDAPTQGTFDISYYSVRLSPSPSDEVIETNMTMILLSGLLPGTEYTVTVVAVVNSARLIPQEEVQVESSPVVFTTFVSAPLFDVVEFDIDGGFIRISWTFVHTGGLNTTVESVCNIDDGASGSGYDLMYVSSCAEMNLCSNENRMGNTSLGPVEAGARYTCVVTAINANGSDEQERGNLTSDIGIPSVPEITFMSFPGRVVLIVTVTYPGGERVYCNVTICPSGDDENEKVMTFSIARDDAIQGAQLTVPVPSGGSFTFTVISFNSLGSLEIPETVEVDNVLPGMITSTPPQPPAPTPSGEPATTTTPSEPTPGGLSGGAVAGIVIAILIIAALIFLIVLVVIYLYIKNRGESYQVDKPPKGTVKMAEVDVDIGTELQTQPQEEPEKPREVQYADLDHFRKKEQTPDDTTPLASSSANPAVEPVTYSEIQPHFVKSETGSQPDATNGPNNSST